MMKADAVCEVTVHPDWLASRAREGSEKIEKRAISRREGGTDGKRGFPSRRVSPSIMSDCLTGRSW